MPRVNQIAAPRNFSDAYVRMYEMKQAKYVTFIVTHDCNLQCSYCYEHNKDSGEMTLETAKNCVDLLFREDARNSGYINEENANALVWEFIGGEPLLKIELIDQIVDYFRSEALRRRHRWAVKYMISMSTNGMLYDNPNVQRFIEKNRGRVSISVTVDGDKETHDRCRTDYNGCGSYDKAVKAFEDVLHRHNQKGTKFTIAPANVDRVFIACKDMIERFQLSHLHCNCVYEEGWTDALAEVLYFELKKLSDWLIESGRYQETSLGILDSWVGHPLDESHTQNWCGGTGRMLAFDVDGTVYPCLRYAPLSMSGRPFLRIGDADHGIGALDEDAATVDMLNGVTRQSQSTEECLNCPIASGCGWCSAYNYEATGSVNKRVTFICPTHKARVMAASYYWNRIYRLRGEKERFPLNIPQDWAAPIVGAEEYELLKELAEEG